MKQPPFIADERGLFTGISTDMDSDAHLRAKKPQGGSPKQPNHFSATAENIAVRQRMGNAYRIRPALTAPSAKPRLEPHEEQVREHERQQTAAGEGEHPGEHHFFYNP